MKIRQIIIASLGLTAIIIGLILIINNLNFQSKAVLTDGKVIDLVKRSSSNYDHNYFPVISYFSKDGQEHTYRSENRSKTFLSIGDKVPIYYNPANPDEAMVKGFYRLHFVFFGLGAILLLFLFFDIAIARQKKKADMLLTQNEKNNHRKCNFNIKRGRYL